jgi:hypothetical protein
VYRRKATFVPSDRLREMAVFRDAQSLERNAALHRRRVLETPSARRFGRRRPARSDDERGVDVQARLSGFSPDGAVLAVGNDQIRQPQ